MEAGVGSGKEPILLFVIISLTRHNVYMTTLSFLSDLDSEEEARNPDFSCWGNSAGCFGPDHLHLATV